MIKKLMEQQSRKANLRFVKFSIQVSAVSVIININISVSVNVIKSGLSFTGFTIAVNHYHNDCDIDCDLLYFIRIPRSKLWCCENIAMY